MTTVANTYSLKQKPNSYYQSLYSHSFTSSLQTGNYVQHFGVTSKLFEMLQLQFPESKQEKFYDIYYDTENYQLAKKNYWLRNRSPENELEEDIWSLKRCTINPNNSGTLSVEEWKITSDITQILSDVLSEYTRKTECDDEIIGGFKIIGIALFPTTRIIFKDSNYFLYVEYLSFGNSKTKTLTGGLKFTSPKIIDDDQEIMDLLKVESGLITPVRSKIIEKINEENPELYEELQCVAQLIPALDYEISHKLNEELPLITLPE